MKTVSNDLPDPILNKSGNELVANSLITSANQVPISVGSIPRTVKEAFEPFIMLLVVFSQFDRLSSGYF